MQAKKILKNVTTVTVGVLFVIATVLTVISGMLHFCLLSKDFYLEYVVDEKYLADVKMYAEEDLREEAIYYGIDVQSVVNCIHEEKIRTLSLEYIEGLYLFFDGKADLPEVYYPSDDFFKVINDHYTALGDINEEEDREIASVFASKVENNINSMSNLTIVTNIFKSGAADFVRGFTGGFWWFAVGSAALFALYVFLKRQTILEWIRSSVGLLCVSSIFTFVPIWALKLFDLPSKLVLMDSPLKTLVDALVYNTVDQTFNLLLVFAIIIFVALVALSAACAIKISRDLTEIECSKEYQTDGEPAQDNFGLDNTEE